MLMLLPLCSKQTSPSSAAISVPNVTISVNSTSESTNNGGNGGNNPDPYPAPVHKSPNIGPIVGGVVGGIAVFAIAAIGFYALDWRKLCGSRASVSPVEKPRDSPHPRTVSQDSGSPSPFVDPYSDDSAPALGQPTHSRLSPQYVEDTRSVTPMVSAAMASAGSSVYCDELSPVVTTTTTTHTHTHTHRRRPPAPPVRPSKWRDAKTGARYSPASYSRALNAGAPFEAGSSAGTGMGTETELSGLREEMERLRLEVQNIREERLAPPPLYVS